MKKNFQYTRRASQRRLFDFEISQQAAAAYRRSELAQTPSVQDDEPNPTLMEGQVLRRKIAETEYQGN